jgi:hypothetical protein
LCTYVHFRAPASTLVRRNEKIKTGAQPAQNCTRLPGFATQLRIDKARRSDHAQRTQSNVFRPATIIEPARLGERLGLKLNPSNLFNDLRARCIRLWQVAEKKFFPIRVHSLVSKRI